MAGRWASVEEVVREYELTSDPADFGALVGELKAKRNEVHPDRAGLESAPAFSRLSEAIEFVENRPTQLVRVSEVTDLVRQVSEALQPRKSVDLDAREALRTSQANLHRQNNPQRIGLGVVGAAITGVFLFPQQFEEHPFIGDVITHPWAFAVWTYLMGILTVIWALMARAERRNRNTLSSLYSRRLLEEALSHLNNPFSRTDLEAALASTLDVPMRRSETLRLINLAGGIDPSELESATDIALSRLLETGIARRASGEQQPLLGEWYELSTRSP